MYVWRAYVVGRLGVRVGIVSSGLVSSIYREWNASIFVVTSLPWPGRGGGG